MIEGTEPQDEMNEILNPVLDEVPEQVEPDLVEGEPVEEVLEPKIDKKSPAYLAGRDEMQKQMQSALDRRIGKEVSKLKAFKDEVNARFLAQDKAAVEALPMPKIDDFLSEPNPDAAFYNAMEKRKAALKTVETPATPAQSEELSQAAIGYNELESVYVQSNPTYLATVNAALPFMTKNLQDALYDTDPATVHKLAGNLALVQELATLTPSKMGRKIAEFELESKKGQPLPKRANAKPAPTATKRGSNTSSVKDISEMSQSEYNKYMATI